MTNPPKNPLRILQVLPELGSGGVERGTIEVARALQAAGHEAWVASAGGAMLPQLESCGAQHITLPLTSKHPFTIYQNAKALAAIIRQHKIDIIHARSRAPAWAAYFAAKQTHTALITTFHGTHRLDGFPLKRHYNSVMARGQSVVAVSDFIKQHILQHYAAFTDTSKVQVIHRGADCEYFDPKALSHSAITKLRNHWHLPKAAPALPIILIPGRITRWKGQHIVIEALGKLAHRNFHAIFLGETGKHPAFLEELQQQVTKLGIAEHTHFVGTTQAMREAYALANVVLCPSTEPEAFGRVPVEAQAMGKPVIAAAHGGAMETIIHEQTGWHVPPADSEALADALRHVLALNESQRQQLAITCRHHAKTHFSTKAMCAGYLNLYESINL